MNNIEETISLNVWRAGIFTTHVFLFSLNVYKGVAKSLRNSQNFPNALLKNPNPFGLKILPYSMPSSSITAKEKSLYLCSIIYRDNFP